MADWMADAIERVKAENRSAGVCENCGGAGVVANLLQISRTGNPYANRTCSRCKGTGKPSSKSEGQKHG